MSSLPPEWAEVITNPSSGLVALLKPLATTPAGLASLEMLASRVSNPRVEAVQVLPLEVEHPEQLSETEGPPATTALVLEVDGGHRSLELWVGPREQQAFAFLRFDSITFSPSFDTSRWGRDEWKFEGAASAVVEALLDCECELEVDEHQWVVSQGEGEPRYLATDSLHSDFCGESGELECDLLDPSLTPGDLFLRATVGKLVPVAGRKSLFHPDLVVTKERAFVPDTEATAAAWRAEFEGLLARAWSSSEVTAFVRARPEARPRLLEAIAGGNLNALMAGDELFANEQEWLEALVSASRRTPMSFMLFAQLERRASHALVRARLEELFGEPPLVEDGMSERVLLQLAHVLGRFDDARVMALVSGWLEGRTLKDADHALRLVLPKLPATPSLRALVGAFVERHAASNDTNVSAVRALWARLQTVP